MIDFRKFRADRSGVLIICTAVLLSNQNCLVLAADQGVVPQASAGAATPTANKQIAAIGIPRDAAVKNASTAPGGNASATPAPVSAGATQPIAAPATPATPTAAASPISGAPAAATAIPAAATPATATPSTATPAAATSNTAAATAATAATTATTPATAPGASPTAVPAGEQNADKIMLKPGQTLVVPSLVTEDLQPTDDALLAAEQSAAYPDSPEAHFIYAVALTRTSHVEDALKEVRAARRLAMAKGGYAYFDKMIQTYEELLANVPDDNRIRYGLAWAYYMKAYLLSQDSKKAQTVIAPTAAPASPSNVFTPKAQEKKVDLSIVMPLLTGISPQLAQQAAQQLPGQVKLPQMPYLQSPKQQAAPFAVAEINKYYDLAIKHLDDLLVRKPDDVWAAAYRWHLYNEHTGDMDSAMAHWKELSKRFPNNPLLYLFMAEGWLKKGNLQESLKNASHAIMLRGLGN
jgi:tetratricopeptide (TPR) repeat protein